MTTNKPMKEDKEEVNKFSKEEIEAAKKARAVIIEENVTELKAIYMAGEICMWDEISSLLSEKDKEIERITADYEFKINMCKVEKNKLKSQLSQPDSNGGYSEEDMKKAYDLGYKRPMRITAIEQDSLSAFDNLILSLSPSKEESKAGFSENDVIGFGIWIQRNGYSNALPRINWWYKEGSNYSTEELFKIFTPPTSKVEAKPSLQEGEKKTTEQVLPIIEQVNKIICSLWQMDKSGDNPLFDKRATHLRVQGDLDFANKKLMAAIDILKGSPSTDSKEAVEAKLKQ